MSVLDTLTLAERAQQLRDPVGKLGLAVAELLAPINREGNERAVADLRVVANDRVLEVGCGLGSMAEMVTRIAPAVSYVGVDRSATMIDAARARHIDAQRISFQLATSEELPFDPGFFTKIFSIGVMHFWDDPIRTLTELHRVMRPGALMIMGGLGPERRPPFAEERHGFHLYKPDQWRSFCHAAGLQEIEVRSSSLGSENGPQIIHLEAHRA